jgi:UDP-N-acetylglucosamine 1-carboxyvinyltransferase
MSSLLIEGGRRLSGRINVEGNKNAALPLLAACLLTSEECVLENMPRIGDVEVMANLLREVGAEVEGVGTTTVRVRCRKITNSEPDSVLVGKLRGSVLLLGPLLARTGRAILGMPGGDFPARRTIGTHVDALVALGARVLPSNGHALDTPDGLKAASFYLDEASVTGTETALLAAALVDGVTEIRHAATEPHVVEVCEFLKSMGVGLTGAGSSTLRVQGRKTLTGATHRLNGDYIEAGSWAVVAAVTGGEIEVRGARAEDVEGIAFVLKRMKVECSFEDGLLTIQESKPVAAGRITTGLWPSFPSDFVSLITVLATQAEGRTLVHDWMYELRLFALEQLSGMRADLFLCDPHRIIVTGPSRLKGKKLDSRDLRSGMALIAAGLAAEGQSRLSPLETVERGYGQLVDRLKLLGAQVEQVEQRMSQPLA